VSDDRRASIVTAIGHASVHAHELAFPLFVALWVEEFALSLSDAGVLLAIGYGAFGLVALPAGSITDWIGALPTIRYSLAGSALAIGIVALAPSRLTLAVGLAGWGIAAGLYHPAGLTALSRLDRRGRALGWHGVAGNVGIGGGPLVVALLLTGIEWRAAVGLLAVPPALGVLAAGRPANRREKATTDDGTGASGATAGGASPTNWRPLLLAIGPVLAILVAAGLYYRGVLSFLPAVLADAPTVAAAGVAGLPAERTVYVGVLLIGVIGQYAGGHLSDRVTPVRGLAGGLAGLALIALAVPPAIARGPGPALLVAGLLGIVLFVLQPLYQTAIATRTAGADRGRAYGLTYASLFGIGALGAVLAGVALDEATTPALFGGLAVIAAVGSGLALAADR
jgi:predicted MFS family arabinose efflux permease